MSTRAMVHFNQFGKTQAFIFRHYDGYPEGLGDDIKKFLKANKELTHSDNRGNHRFDDSTILAARFVVWQAKEYAEGKLSYLDFTGLRIETEDSGDAEYIYTLDCDNLDSQGFPVLKTEEV